MKMLPPEQMRRGDPDALGVELLEMIAHDIENQERSLQKEIGPSQVGSPCGRKVLYGMLQVPKVNMLAPPKLKAYVGTGAHLMLAGMLDRYNLLYNDMFGFEERFYVEEELQVGEIDGEPLVGHCDVYDRATCTVVDWKTSGPTLLKHYRASGPGPQYRTQAHLYGRGWATYRGLPVDRVMLIFIPRQGELKDAVVWHEPYDEQIALDALQRCDGLAMAARYAGPDTALQMLPPVEDFCGDCDWFAPQKNVADIYGCPGAPREIRIPESPITFEGRTL
jgi:hypothetical protein